jgi:hypothetical protein
MIKVKSAGQLRNMNSRKSDEAYEREDQYSSYLPTIILSIHSKYFIFHGLLTVWPPSQRFSDACKGNGKGKVVGFEVLTALVMKIVFFWDVVLRSWYMNRRFGGRVTIFMINNHLSKKLARSGGWAE